MIQLEEYTRKDNSWCLSENITRKASRLSAYTLFTPLDVDAYWVDLDYSLPQESKTSIWNHFAVQKDDFELVIDVANNKLVLPVSLKDIANHIKESEVILNYEWEDDTCIQTDIDTYLNAINFVINYSKQIYEEFGLIINTPYIDALPDGGVSVHWNTENSEFLIIFKKNKNPYAYYYGRRKDNNIPFKSGIEIGKPIDESLTLWMKKNLT